VPAPLSPAPAVSADQTGGDAADAPLTTRAKVLNRSAALALSADRLDALTPSARGRAVRVRLDDRTLVDRGDPAGGTTVRRIVLVSTRATERRTIQLSAARNVTLPRRTPRVGLRIEPSPETTVETVRANGRVVLHRPAGLSGRYTVATARSQTTRLAFVAGGDPAGDVTVSYYPARTRKAVLEVTVDD
jgi:hypothetical protein